MPYQISKPFGSSNRITTIPDNAVDNQFYDSTTNATVGIQLVGQNTLNYGTAIAQNFVQLASNFAGTVPPNGAIPALQGQLWFDVTNPGAEELKINVSSGAVNDWKKVLIGSGPGGVLSTSQGGTGSATYSVGDLLVGTTGNTLTKLGVGSEGYVLKVVSGIPAWAAAGGGGGGSGTVTSVGFSTGTTGLTVSSSTANPIISSGTFTLGGTLNVANGGTGATTLTGYVKGTGTSALTASSTIPVSDLSGTLAIANGGTGQTTANAALNALLPSQSGNANKVLTTNGTTTSWQDVTGLQRFEATTAIPTNSVSLSHGLGGMPFFYSVSFRCVSPQAGLDYVAGDEVPANRDDGINITTVTPWANATTIGISFYTSSNNIRLATKTGSTVIALNPANWQLVFRAQGISSPSPANTPVANFTATPLSGTEPLTVNFTDSSTNSPTSWLWNFGDGTTSTLQNPSKTYSVGVYTVSLTATNSFGNGSIVKSGYINVSSSGGGE